MFVLKEETLARNSRTGCPSSTLWLYLTVEFLIGTFLSGILAILAIVKALLPKPPRDLTGDVVVIAGTASSLGVALAEEFAKDGCSVICVDSDSNLIEETVSRLRTSYPRIEEVESRHSKNDTPRLKSTISSYECNLLNKDDIGRTARKIKDEIGRVDVLVTCVGTVDQDIFDTASKTLMSHFWTVLAFLPLMLYQKRAHIVGVTPVASSTDAYHSSRAAITSLMESLGQELSNHSSHLMFLAFSPIADHCALKERKQQVARDIVHAVRTDQSNLSVSWMSRFLYRLSCATYHGITTFMEFIYSQGCDYSA
ncbi:estradiol 17-beta-dehydrogenase 11-like [Colletes gigas]|uniref:estradiol 17-beta-dehydrogenase 11-like n=1 Tax=Colletes gigas TaxID=935657 RepID=UPI001C9B3D83|nr:estradiol 17-beta-dehydrogenase 11-like [Colletes gigas]XP_043261581.1 estradiol 17-beta-dehydrogenase 11-like [Colletes gigas]XP_043261582.1 estradiol 17-beta-dehydrogenase 11-like [Colletes gigas]XP_043261583.1 estradiol 17-beta-dehydrogenase 11-like [Colletes gigas]